MTCTFYGPRSLPDESWPQLRAAIRHLILRRGVTRFYVGNDHRFDTNVLIELADLKETEFPQIQYTVILTRSPTEQFPSPLFTSDQTLTPKGIRRIPRFLARRQRFFWMLARSEWLIAYVPSRRCPAARLVRKANRMQKNILCLSPEPILP